MTKPLFIAQDSLEHLVSDAKISLDGFTLTVVKTGKSYLLVPAALILSCESSPDADPLFICDKVVPMDVLNSADAVIYLNSITIKNHSYLIDHGYICKTPEPQL